MTEFSWIVVLAFWLGAAWGALLVVMVRRKLRPKRVTLWQDQTVFKDSLRS